MFFWKKYEVQHDPSMTYAWGIRISNMTIRRAIEGDSKRRSDIARVYRARAQAKLNRDPGWIKFEDLKLRAIPWYEVLP